MIYLLCIPVPCSRLGEWPITHAQLSKELCFMSELKSNFFKVPNVIAFTKIPFAPLKVLLYFLTWQNSKNGCYSKQDTIAEKCDMSLPTVKRAISWLAKEKYITIYSGKSEHTTNIYEVNFENIDGYCVRTSEENELREIDFNREMALKTGKREQELREKFDKTNKGITQ